MFALEHNITYLFILHPSKTHDEHFQFFCLSRTPRILHMDVAISCYTTVRAVGEYALIGTGLRQNMQLNCTRTFKYAPGNVCKVCFS